MVVCGHSLEVNVTSSLDFYLSVAQVQLLQQLFRDNMVGMDTPEKIAEVHKSPTLISTHYHQHADNKCPSKAPQFEPNKLWMHSLGSMMAVIITVPLAIIFDCCGLIYNV